MADSGPVNSDPQRDLEADVTVEKYHRLPSGRALTTEEAYAVTAASRTRLILLAGMPKSGKTTLIASLFHAFQRGPIDGLAFAGSQTLLGFDARCHDARIASERDAPTTERTKTGTAEIFLHLSVRYGRDEAASELLFIDMSGEHYDAILDSLDECKNVPCLRRADYFVLLIDGEKLSHVGQRQTAKCEARMLLRACFDSGQLNSTSLVDVLISKWDSARASENFADVTAFVDKVEEEFNQQFSHRCAQLHFARIAARPNNSLLPLGWGLNDVFVRWAVDVPETFRKHTPPVVGDVHSEFDRIYGLPVR